MTNHGNFTAARAFVDFGLREKESGRRESASGPGSSKQAAAPSLTLIDAVIDQHGVKSILDLGCGDWNWMAQAAWRRSGGVRYEGWDAHPQLIDDLNARFGGPETSFKLADIVTSPFPKADLFICRDVLFHLPVEMAAQVVKKVRDHGGLFISTSFPGKPSNDDIAAYLPIDGWGFHVVNLDLAPFNLQPYKIRSVEEPGCQSHGFERSICLYSF